MLCDPLMPDYDRWYKCGTKSNVFQTVTLRQNRYLIRIPLYDTVNDGLCVDKTLYKSPPNMYLSCLHTFVTNCGILWTLESLPVRRSLTVHVSKTKNAQQIYFKTFNVKESLLLRKQCAFGNGFSHTCMLTIHTCKGHFRYETAQTAFI